MTQEEKSLLLKDLCARLPYEVKCYIKFDDGKIFNERTLAPIMIQDFKKHSFVSFVPYLRPMSSMTKEERDEVEEISHGWFYINEDGEIFPTGKFTDSGEFEDAILPTFEYFLKNHIDYRGLIPKGLALEAKEGMYEY